MVLASRRTCILSLFRTCSHYCDAFVCYKVLEQRHEACIVPPTRGLSVSLFLSLLDFDGTKTYGIGRKQKGIDWCVDKKH